MSVLLAAKSTGRRLRTASLQQWDQHKPRPHMVQRAMQALEKALPPQWLQPMKLLGLGDWQKGAQHANGDRKSTRLNSSHLVISYAVFCLKKKNKEKMHHT